MDISAKTKDHPEVVTAQYDMPASLAELTNKFGEEAVYEAAKGAIVISIQAYMRRHLDKDAAELQGLVSAWQPGVRTPGVKKTAFETVTSKLGALSPEERAEILKALKAKG